MEDNKTGIVLGKNVNYATLDVPESKADMRRSLSLL